MKLIDEQEVVHFKIALSLIFLGTIPQLIYGYWLLKNGDIIHNLGFAPLALWLVLCVPGAFWAKFCINLATTGVDEDVRPLYREAWWIQTPLHLWIPLFHFHAGVTYIVRLTFVLVCRYLMMCMGKDEEEVEYFRTDGPYIFIRTDKLIDE